MFFKCIVVYFVGVGTKRLDIFRKRVESFGGCVAPFLIDSVTHVVVDETLLRNPSQLTSTLPVDCKDAKIVSTEWLCGCLKEKRLLDSQPFLVEVSSSSKKSISSLKRQISCTPESSCSTQLTQEHESRKGASEINKEDYLCSKSASTKKFKFSSNEAIIAELQKLADTYRVTKDTWRLFSYEKAISAISKYDQEITTYQEALKIPGIGEKLALKIMEIIESGSLRKVTELCENEENHTLKLFCDVWGAGPSTASCWYRSGYRSLDQLRGCSTLTQQQQVGLKYFNDFNERIPRSEVELLGKEVNKAVAEVSLQLATHLVGSFRRGKDTCGDIDVMIVNQSPLTSSQVLLKTLTILKSKGIVTDDLTIVEDSGKQRKWMGVARVYQLHRRLDLFVVPKGEEATALVHFTGSALFNRSIRLLAARKGMCLSEHGLYCNTVRKDNEIIHEGQLIPISTEEEIFSRLELEYKTPEERDH